MSDNEKVIEEIVVTAGRLADPFSYFNYQIFAYNNVSMYGTMLNTDVFKLAPEGIQPDLFVEVESPLSTLQKANLQTALEKISEVLGELVALGLVTDAAAKGKFGDVISTIITMADIMSTANNIQDGADAIMAALAGNEIEAIGETVGLLVGLAVEMTLVSSQTVAATAILATTSGAGAVGAATIAAAMSLLVPLAAGMAAGAATKLVLNVAAQEITEFNATVAELDALWAQANQPEFEDGGGFISPTGSGTPKWWARINEIFGFGSFTLFPIVLDLDGDGIELTEYSETNFRYDVDGDGFAELTDWVSGDDGILVWDMNGDNRVSRAEFVFADLIEGEATDLEGLRTLDSNSDGVIDSEDEVYGELKVWQDKNQNGEADDGEMVRLEEAGIKSINLNGDADDYSIGDSTVFETVEFVRTAPNGQELTFIAGDVGLYGDSNSGERIVELDNGGYISVGENSLTVLNLQSVGKKQSIKVGKDKYEGLSSFDLVATGNGNDKIVVIEGERVTIDAGAGNDSIIGGSGSDVIYGGTGNDKMTGSAGNDFFYVSQGDDKITDFTPGEDRIAVSGLSLDDIELVLSSAVQKGGSVLLEFGDDSTLLLKDVDLEDLELDDFFALAA